MVVVHSDSVMDPALAAHVLKIEYRPQDVSFGSYEDMLRHVENVLAEHDFALGDRFTALDVQWGSALYWGLEILKTLPRKKILLDYVERCSNRPAFQKAIITEQSWLSPSPAGTNQVSPEAQAHGV